jgi:hypothetical protein
MPVLASNLRRQLEHVCVRARELAEAAAHSALQMRAVDAAEPFAHFSAADKALRNRLRARGRQAGDVRDEKKKTQTIDQLTQELAYEYWHRMLFARFLAENNLLMHPDGVSVSLEECDELARAQPRMKHGSYTDNERDDLVSSDPCSIRVPSVANGFVLAGRYASRMLPQIFRTDDVLLEIEFAPNQRIELEKQLSKLPRETFLADDSLGWVYQFWQAKKKDEVNKSGAKIDGRTLPAVTQLFTEDYMVQFLLHNTIGAWWCARHGIKPRMEHGSNTDQKSKYLNGIDPCLIRVSSVAMPSLEYLRWRDDGTPAAGTFDGWPTTLKDFTMLDPCCGSGHFLVSAFNLLVPLRMHDEGLQAREACEAVLGANLFGLEIDPRCTQIAAFALALAAWRYPGEDGQPLGYRALPRLNIACAGIGPQATQEQWLKLAELSGRRMTAVSREPIRNGLLNLHELFSQASTLGSLIDPNELPADLISADYETLQPFLASVWAAETKDEELRERAIAAQGMARAAELLAGEYTLVATNVPYLKGERHGPTLHAFLAENYSASKGDLATAFVERCIGLSKKSGSVALVTLQAWLFLTRRAPLRRKLLTTVSWETLARLGPRAFSSISGEVVNIVLLLLTNNLACDEQRMYEIDVAEGKNTTEKAQLLRSSSLITTRQATYLATPDYRIGPSDLDLEILGKYCVGLHGQSTFDSACFEFFFWEVGQLGIDWVQQQLTTRVTQFFDGCSGIIRWENGAGLLARLMEAKKAEGYTSGAWRAGVSCWGKRGVLISQMDTLACSLYLGHSFDSNTAAIIPHDLEHLQAVWAYCSSLQFVEAVRKLDRSLKVTNASLVKVPFDLAHWQKVAAEKYPNGLPKPYSSDPTQWLFNGHPAGSGDPLQVAAARLLGYRWPRQTGSSFPDCPALGPDGLEGLANREGIVCIPAIRGEPPAADRLLELLAKASEPRIEHGSNTDQNEERMNHSSSPIRVSSVFHPWPLLSAAGCKPGTSLDDWLRNSFFDQHCKRFHQRPFIWHIWDGRKDGFSCLVNYHELDHVRLESLTYAYLGDWIKAQAAEARAKAEKVGAGLRLEAAQKLQEKLKLILAGEPPYDIFVRWKPLSEQAIGWHPDLNDGVRMNIRPFVEADILRKTPNIKWTKDRGKEPERDKGEYPWFRKGKEPGGERVNDVHLTNEEKLAARKRAKG